MKFKIKSLNGDYVTWTLNGVLGKCEIHNGIVQRTYIPDGLFTLTTKSEEMVVECVQAWHNIKFPMKV